VPFPTPPRSLPDTEKGGPSCPPSLRCSHGRFGSPRPRYHQRNPRRRAAEVQLPQRTRPTHPRSRARVRRPCGKPNRLPCSRPLANRILDNIEVGSPTGRPRCYRGRCAVWTMVVAQVEAYASDKCRETFSALRCVRKLVDSKVSASYQTTVNYYQVRPSLQTAGASSSRKRLR
jgi:hypothetical protein